MRAEIAQTVASLAEPQDELRYLLTIAGCSEEAASDFRYAEKYNFPGGSGSVN